ncbi:MAG: hypothetical protein L0Z62_51005 [Gemmataceae bacterium]|nr:hypothetical protein [Gemmataceae bacterium]
MSAARNLRLPLVLAACVAVAAAPLLLAEQAPVAKGEADKFTTTATTIESADFLKPPAGLDPKTFTVAKTAPKVDVCFFAGLDPNVGKPWSSWGDGCLASNGKYYTSVGDHRGTDANSFVYEYNPMTRILSRVVDVLRVIMHMLGLFGHGKIHSGIHEGADGWLYFSTYWGKPKEVETAFTKGYPGSLLLRHNPKTGQTENLGALAPRQGLPASNFDRDRGLLYFHAVYKGDVVVYDTKAQKVKFQGGADQSAAHRTFLIDGRGRAHFSANDGTLAFYDPETNKLGKTTVRLPANPEAKKKKAKAATLRAASRPMRSGLVHGMTAAGQLFSFDPHKGEVKDLGPNFAGGDYTAVMVLSPDEKYLYYAPGAHGSANRTAAPVLQYEIATGKRKVLAFLRDPLAQRLKYNIGGTYNLQIDPSGERLFFTFNGSDPGVRGFFGKPAVAVIHIPKAER